ncbi:hypothetical protein [Bifidobacterium sp.]|jgi:hypothetical protein|uniref:hypothetical protein n=1 Tax=Bifidobacterium sp. TaxID=41200 RepID=UPI0025BB5E8B|nr:hypothetical protein [Bifidobacterium sp.]MCH4210052.1 hypothetical protein [Bifidobacterium sp.]
MNNLNVNNSGSGLDALTTLYGAQLRDASHTLGLPDDYQISPSVNSDGAYGLSVVSLDKSGEMAFDRDIAQGSMDTALIAAQAIVNLAKASGDAMHDSLRRVDRKHAIGEAEDERFAAAEWHSRFEGVDKPLLLMKHTPGFEIRDAGSNRNEIVKYIFRSSYKPLGLDFAVMENTPGGVEASIMPGDWDWAVDSPQELLDLLPQIDVLKDWLKDIAAVTVWCHDHDAIKEDAR